MAVLQTVSNGRCKICQSPERHKIEAMLEHRHHRRKDLEGNRINSAYVIKRMAAWGIQNPNEDNINTHQSKHMKFVEDNKKLSMVSNGRQTTAKLNAGAPHVDVDENLRWIISVGRSEIEERMIRGDKSGITTDHMLKATAELTRRQHNEAQHELLGALVGGIGHAIGAVPQKELNPVPEAIVLSPQDVEDISDAEIVESPLHGQKTWRQKKREKEREREAAIPDWVAAGKPIIPKTPQVSAALQLARKNPPKKLLAEMHENHKRPSRRKQQALPEWVKTGRPVEA